MADQMDQGGETKGGDTSNTNTILLVIIIAAAVVFAGWWFMGRSQAPTDENADGVNVEVNLPDAEEPDGTAAETTP
ncbi:MAG: hypothetical protein Q8P99_00235 [bacterium]|nr:hypothetical protein [bacterium]